MEFMLDVRATDTELVVFWDKPECADAGTGYRVLLYDGDKIGEPVRCAQVQRTHCTFDGLAPDHAYRAQVCLPDGRLSLECRTTPVKERLDISREPYGAVGDGKTCNTVAIQRAIDDCGPQQAVYIPAGVWLTGALDLHSDMELILEEGATLQGTEDRRDYLPKIPSRFEGHERECYRSLLNLGRMDHDAPCSCAHVVIRGKGRIMGGGAALAKDIAQDEAKRLEAYIASLGDRISEYEKPETISHRARGRLINMSNCHDIWIHGLDVGFSPSWNLHFIYSDRIVTDHCRFFSRGVWNGDGWDPDSSTDCTLFACEFFTEDDSVAIKSGKNPEGNRIARPSRNIRIFDSVCRYGHGLCIGSEMSGGVEGIRIWDCEMGPTWSGIEIKATRKRGGYVRDVVVRDCTASHVMLHSVGFNDDGEAAREIPVIENCRFEGLYLLGRYLDNNAGHMDWHSCPSIELVGFAEAGHEIRDVRFARITMENPHRGETTDIYRPTAGATGSIYMENCGEGISLESIRTVSEHKEYPLYKD
ncbi:MAG: glycoside hydrolase family 28 protein [Lachnospiraceae bacterium]|nr:glycoside hydrolase family 28 protein [Lachnospiraceae bacterium]